MSVGISEMSKTYQYRKVMKPMLERKRRARINKCLDELKDLMVATLESEGEHVTRLEKADILELTVTHLQKMKQQRKLNKNGGIGTMSQAEGFRSGYIHAVNEVSRSLSELPGVNINLGTQLMTHLGQRLNQLQPTVKPAVPITTPLSVHIGGHANYFRAHYTIPISPVSSVSDSPNSSMCSEKNSNNNLLLTTINSGCIRNTSLSSAATSPSTSSANNTTIDVTTLDENSTAMHEDIAEDEENVWRPW